MNHFSFQYSILTYIFVFFFVYFLLSFFGVKTKKYRFLGFILALFVINLISYNFISDLITSNPKYYEAHSIFINNGSYFFSKGEWLMIVLPTIVGLAYGLHSRRKKDNDKDKDTN